MAVILAQSVGVDISKDTLDVHIHPMGVRRRMTNDQAGFAELVAWLADHGVARVVFEPTGRYHRAFERTLGQAGLPLVKVNPRQARRFAQASGKLAKTDAVDAAMLARMGAALEPPTHPIISQTLDDMQELHLARRALVKDRIAAKTRNEMRRSALLKQQAQDRLTQIDTQIAAIAALRRLCDADARLKQRFDILTSIPGVGETTAMAILVNMPELGALENKAVASLAGLAPVARDSGRLRGKRFIQGGRAHIRHALYMPAIVAIRWNADLKAKYQALIAAGKPTKVAITAVMRKLLILANALVRNGRRWEEARP